MSVKRSTRRGGLTLLIASALVAIAPHAQATIVNFNDYNAAADPGVNLTGQNGWANANGVFGVVTGAGKSGSNGVVSVNPTNSNTVTSANFTANDLGNVSFASSPLVDYSIDIRAVATQSGSTAYRFWIGANSAAIYAIQIAVLNTGAITAGGQTLATSTNYRTFSGTINYAANTYSMYADGTLLTSNRPFDNSSSPTSFGNLRVNSNISAPTSGKIAFDNFAFVISDPAVLTTNQRGALAGTVSLTGSNGSYLAQEIDVENNNAGIVKMNGLGNATDDKAVLVALDLEFTSGGSTLADVVTYLQSKASADKFTVTSLAAAGSEPGWLGSISGISNVGDYDILLTYNAASGFTYPNPASPLYFNYDFIGGMSGVTVDRIAVVPEPAAISLIGLTGLIASRRNRRQVRV